MSFLDESLVISSELGMGPLMERVLSRQEISRALRRDRTGEGQWLEVAMLDGGITLAHMTEAKVTG